MLANISAESRQIYTNYSVKSDNAHFAIYSPREAVEPLINWFYRGLIFILYRLYYRVFAFPTNQNHYSDDRINLIRN